MTQKQAGTPNYMAPEVLREEQYNIKADIYSYSLIVWEMISNEEPFEGYSYSKMYARVGMNGERPDVPKHCPSDLANLITTCWSQDPLTRPMMKDVVITLEQLAMKYPTEENTMCSVCKKEKKCMAFAPCGHVYSCERCLGKPKECPLCHRIVDDSLRIYI
eukprot:TRINITY_DN3888_c0_g1_i4.p1 TRINITY_DN3888_c0_g1~~TRINITY_DN3888_c0_g1_i4.p1  ORF type:complete len:161 (-),score=31.23 TRINITY_DN3888_c0_g1_i4:72-554(-)